MRLSIDLDSQDIQTVEEFRVLSARLAADPDGLSDGEFDRLETVGMMLGHKLVLSYIEAI